MLVYDEITLERGGWVFRAYRCEKDYPGLAGKILISGNTFQELEPKDDKVRP